MESPNVGSPNTHRGYICYLLESARVVYLEMPMDGNCGPHSLVRAIAENILEKVKHCNEGATIEAGPFSNIQPLSQRNLTFGPTHQAAMTSRTSLESSGPLFRPIKTKWYTPSGRVTWFRPILEYWKRALQFWRQLTKRRRGFVHVWLRSWWAL